MEGQQPMPVPAPPGAHDSLVECALKVLQCPDPWKKAEYTCSTVKMWREGVIQRVRPAQWRHLRAPDRPARSDDKVRVCAPGEVPRRGKGGTLASRQALLHSAVHIESWAVDLSWDAVARFGLQPDEYDMPRQFFDDFVTVAEDECRHFTALAKRLEETGSYYGAFPGHDGLWESASGTSHSLPARLAVEHCVHEARGLDVLPATIAKFANNGDRESAALLRDVVYPEEVSHCAAGVRWIKYMYDIAHGRREPAGPVDALAPAAGASPVAAPPPPTSSHGTGADGTAGAGADTGGTASDAVSEQLTQLVVVEPAEEEEEGADRQQRDVAKGGLAAGASGGGGGSDSGGLPAPVATLSWVLDARKYGSVEEWFHSLVQAHFWGALKPPFNEEARAKAGFGPDWYLPLAVQQQQTPQEQPPEQEPPVQQQQRTQLAPGSPLEERQEPAVLVAGGGSCPKAAAVARRVAA